MNVSEFERTKPVVTMQKLNELIKLIDEERVKTEILYRDRVRSLDDISILLKDMKKSFMKGE
jgi:D-arabinose 1-dehydrogenase-like Zn-dependent alcohol dehydrogenase